MRGVLNQVHPDGRIISIDINPTNIHERAKVPGITFYRGSSVSDETYQFVKATIAAYACSRVMVILDSDHEEDHVLREMELYAPLVTIGSMLVVEDTNNHPGPIGAVRKYFPKTGWEPNIICEKFMVTFNRDGYWERML